MIADAIAKLWSATVQANAMIWHPSAAITAEKLIATGSGQPFLAGPAVAALPKYMTNQIALGGSATPKIESTIFVGLWSELMIGMRTEARVEISRRAPGVREARRRLWSVYLVSRELV
jgi:hypothetical protein